MKPHESAREAVERELTEEPREHLWDSLPVRCWCGEQHVLGVDDVDDDESSADDPNAPDIDERIEERSDEEADEP